MLSGILEDNGEPLLFATVAVYRNDILIRGVETDLDGKYSIECLVGDKLEFSYIGYTPKSIIVTEKMLHGINNAPRQSIEKISSKVFALKMEERKKRFSTIQKTDSLDNSNIVKAPNRNAIQNAKGFKIKNGIVSINKVKDPLKYNLSLTQYAGVRTVLPWHKHQLQSTYSQGRPVDGTLQFQDHTTGEAFSFGPKISDLAAKDIKVQNQNLLRPSVSFGTSATFDIERNDQKIYATFNNLRSNDIFNRNKSINTDIRLGFIKFTRHRSYWNVEMNINRLSQDNHNFNGYYHKTLQAMMVQSPNFDMEGDNEKSIGYSSSFQSPNGLLAINNPVLSNTLNIIINQYSKSYDPSLRIKNTLNISHKRSEVLNGLHNRQMGLPENFDNKLDLRTPNILLATHLKKYELGLEDLSLEINNMASAAKMDFRYQDQNNTYNTKSQFARNTTSAELVYDNFKSKVKLGINTLLATNQPSNIFNPHYYVSHIHDVNKKYIDKIQFFVAAQRTTKQQDFFLDRYNYSSLLFPHHQLKSQILDAPLWLPDDLKNEIKDEYKIGIQAGKYYAKSTFHSKLEYTLSEQHNVIFPVLEDGNFILRNAADITVHQIKWYNDWEGRKTIFGHKVYFDNAFEINHFISRVDKLHTNADRVPFGGFSDISKNLIEGNAVGVIVGSDFNRNEKGELLIEEDGFPTKADGLRIIADPTPLFNFSYTLGLRIKKFTLEMTIDGQVGGDVWNGTQQNLDYYGMSQHSASQREKDNYIFEGVSHDGDKNQIEVALADSDSELKDFFWIRYGEEGVASAYIRDASHINLRSVKFSYYSNEYGSQQYKISLYIKNLLTLAAFKGFTTSHLYEDNISYGLQFFNQPITTEFGTSITYNF